MKEHKIIVLGLLVILLSIPITTHASIYFQSFGGKITNTKATKIQQAEEEGYICEWFSGSIDINPVRGEKSYLTTFTNSTRTNPMMNQQILGLYGFVPTAVTCTNPETESVKVLFIPQVRLPWGTSRSGFSKDGK